MNEAELKAGREKAMKLVAAGVAELLSLAKQSQDRHGLILATGAVSLAQLMEFIVRALDGDRDCQDALMEMSRDAFEEGN